MGEGLGLMKISVSPQAQVALALVHHPILDRDGKIVATNITNFDIHDIARACRVFGVKKYFIVHPMAEQLMFVERVLDHWRVGTGSRYNPSRKKALENLHTVRTLEEAQGLWHQNALTIMTHARSVLGARSWSFQELRTAIHGENRPCLLVFGTGYGLTDEMMKSGAGVLESIRGFPPDDFRHLSVRSAVSICLDRLMGEW